jgi:hypothetical protein
MIAHDSEPKRTGLIDRLLFEHPRKVNEGYLEHAAIAGRFGLKMLAGGFKCVIHAIVPGLHDRAASDTVHALHGELERRRRMAADTDPDYVI